MKEKPIIFSTPMVRAILEGRKTQTRRVIKPLPIETDKFIELRTDNYKSKGFKDLNGLKAVFKPNNFDGELRSKSKYQPGDILWVRETWGIGGFNEDTFEMFVIYKSDNSNSGIVLSADKFQKYYDGITAAELDWRPSIHMPREAARIFLRVIEARAERLQDISEIDALSEGCDGEIAGTISTKPVQEYAALWDSLNAKRDSGIYTWGKNPFVWVYSFKRIEK